MAIGLHCSCGAGEQAEQVRPVSHRDVSVASMAPSLPDVRPVPVYRNGPRHVFYSFGSEICRLPEVITCKHHQLRRRRRRSLIADCHNHTIQYSIFALTAVPKQVSPAQAVPSFPLAAPLTLRTLATLPPSHVDFATHQPPSPPQVSQHPLHPRVNQRDPPDPASLNQTETHTPCSSPL